MTGRPQPLKKELVIDVPAELGPVLFFFQQVKVGTKGKVSCPLDLISPTRIRCAQLVEAEYFILTQAEPAFDFFDQHERPGETAELPSQIRGHCP